MKQLTPSDDLSSVDPQGRIDVLVFNGAGYLTKLLETQFGVSGIWDNLRPHVNKAIVQGLSGIELPIEAKVLLGIMQANIKRGEEGKG